ncbi:ABC transporter substrate-binding protein [Microbacterium betulae]|uniref:ABC transporter substrate-binding protein n=1 Tax=Microbacterium betulae TaxID=2981139 RepID=A0AA97FH06_9MICO|nr:ABC transporter substrate-binding protein [Microbacterium sp. AB]WOF22354.1 ABC transporter substrate-binding protein [Microbacterium sp. AB]
MVLTRTARIRAGAFVMALAASTTLLAACTPAEGDADQAATQQPQSGGDVVVGISADPTCLDPQQNGNAASISASRQVVDSLTDLDPETGEVLPWLAESWTVDDDATSFTFTLRDDVTFSDGSALDADVVVRNFDTIASLGAATSLVTGYLAGYEGATAIDEHTVQIDFSTPSAGFLATTSVVQLGIVAESTLEKTAEERCAPESIVGTGPFVYDSYTQNESTVLTRRDGYGWPSARAAHEGDAYLDSVTFQVVSESSVRVGSLQSGQLDAITDVQPTDEETLAGAGFDVIDRANPGVVNTLYPRASNKITADAAVRQAIQIGIDRDQLASVLSASYASATSVLATSTPGYADVSDELAYAPDAAAALLDDAGWETASDGVREKDGVRLSLDVAYLNSVVTNQSVLELVQQQLGDIGVELTLRPLAVADYLEAVQEPDLAFSFGNFTRSEADVLRTTFGGADTNPARFADDDLTGLFTALQTSSDETARAETSADIQQFVVEAGYGIPVYELAQVAATSTSLHDVSFDSSSRIFLYDAWLAN